MTKAAISREVKIFAWVMVAWNLIGIAAFVGEISMTAEDLAVLPPDLQVIYQNTPMWVYIAYGVAVFGGFIGSVLLALGKKLSFAILSLSLAGVMLQQFYSLVVVDLINKLGPSIMIMPVIVLACSVILVVVSRRGAARGWLV